MEALSLPVEQLKLIHAEVDRQRAVMSQRRSNMFTRATILVAASGVLTSVLALNWASPWQFISAAISIMAAGFGVWAMWPRTVIDSDATLNFKARLEADPYSTEYSIVSDNMDALASNMASIEKLGQVVSRGYAVLVLSWLVTLLVAVFAFAKII